MGCEKFLCVGAQAVSQTHDKVDTSPTPTIMSPAIVTRITHSTQNSSYLQTCTGRCYTSDSAVQSVTAADHDPEVHQSQLDAAQTAATLYRVNLC